MQKSLKISDKEILNRLSILPEIKKIEIIDFLEFLSRNVMEEERERDINNSILAVEETWGSIKLTRKDIKYIAENKEIEYEF